MTDTVGKEVMPDDGYYMEEAIKMAKRAAELGEVPVGAVIVKDGKIIAEAYNLRETDKLSTAHAELLAIEKACKELGGWRLSDCELYVTLEPCPMCAGAIVNSRISRVIYGARDASAGCCGSVINFNAYPFNHAFSVKGGVMEDRCAALLKSFFESKRNKR